MKTFTLAAIIWLALACGMDAERDGPPEKGLPVVDNPELAEVAGTWMIDGSPTVTIGDDTRGPAYGFTRITGAVELTDGRLVVADAPTGELRVFSPQGEHLTTIGRKGKGPGEFNWISNVWLGSSDSMIVFDGQLRRLSIFDGEGHLVLTHDLSTLGHFSPLGRLPDGDLLATGFVMDMSRATSGPSYRQVVPLVRIDPEGGHMDTLQQIAGTEVYPILAMEAGNEFPAQMEVEFGRFTVLMLDGTRLYVGANDRFEIRIQDGDTLVRLIRMREPARPVTAQDRAETQRRNLENIARWREADVRTREYYNKQIREARYADSIPYYERFLGGPGNQLWVQAYVKSSQDIHRFVVFDSTGKVMAKLEFPPGVRPLFIARDHVIAVWRDENEAQYLGSFRLMGDTYSN